MSDFSLLLVVTLLPGLLLLGVHLALVEMLLLLALRVFLQLLPCRWLSRCWRFWLLLAAGGGGVFVSVAAAGPVAASAAVIRSRVL